MTIGPISADGLSQYVQASSNSTQLQQTLQTLQSSLGLGDLTGAQSAFQTLQQLNQNLTTASGGTWSSGSQLSADLTTLGNALSSGDLSTAQSAFATVQNDLKGASPALAVEVNAASQSQQLVEELLSPLNSSGSSSTTSDNTTSLLQAVYGASSLNLHA